MSVGTTLTQLRRERGKTLADVESATRIMGRHLSAIENERWDDLPATVYVKGYIQNYARFLGVDPAPLLAEFAKDVGDRTEKPHLRHIPEQTVVPHRMELNAIPPQAWRAIAVAVVVVALLVWGVSALFGRDKQPTPIAPETTATVDGATSTDAETQPEQSADSATTPGSFVLKVSVAEGQSSWLQVRVDSLVAYEGTLTGGSSKQWTVADSATVRVGKPASVTITRDGQPVQIPSVTGIAEVTLNSATE